MALHPQAAAFLAGFTDPPALESLPPAEQRQNIRNVIERTGPRTELAAVSDERIETPGRGVPVRIYRPSTGSGLPV